MKENKKNNPKTPNNILDWTRLKSELDQHKFTVKPKHQKNLLNWAQFWYRGSEYLTELVEEIVSLGQCQGCQMPEYVIDQECEAGDKKPHLTCAGCDKACDNGAKRDNDFYAFRSRKWGAYVFQKMNGKQVEEWYCSACKFELLCGDCGSPHELDTSKYVKLSPGEFYICDSCEFKREQSEHEENHAYESDPDCRYCEERVEEHQEKPSEESKIKQFLLTHSLLLKSGEKEQIKMVDYRDKIFDRMIDELRKYYKRVQREDYRYAGMPQIRGGIRRWAEEKIWQLLILIGEPNHLRYKDLNNDYWTEEK